MKLKKIFLLALPLFLGLHLRAQDSITPHTLLWKIEGKGIGAPSYIYGTMHVNDDKVYSLSDSVLPALKGAHSFVMEVDMDSVDMAGLASEVRLPEGQSLKTLLSEDDYKMVSKSFKKATGFPLSLFNKIKPMYVWVMMSEGDEGKKDKKVKKTEKEEGDPLDVYFFKLAKQENKEVYGLEKVEDQLRLLRSISMDRQLSMLVEGVKSMQKGHTPGSEDDIYDEYVNADLDKILKEAQEDTSMGSYFMDVFINHRNHVMASRIAQLMQT